MHGVYTFIHVDNIANMELGKITMHQYAQAACSLAPVVAYDLGLAPLGIQTSLRLVAHYNRLWSDQ